ncbi:MAG: hypothetical protein V9F82_06015 [Dermatophilaceae bacterium]
MRAIAKHVPTVTVENTGAETARVVAEYQLSAFVVIRDDGIDGAGSDELCRRIARATIGTLLPAGRGGQRKLPSVLSEDTPIEVATLAGQDSGLVQRRLSTDVLGPANSGEGPSRSADDASSLDSREERR